MEQPIAASTKESPGPYDALGKALPGEPIFPLKASDPDAPDTILHWADLRRRRARNFENSEVRRAELAQCSNAEACAWEFEDWRKSQLGNAAEEVHAVRVNYSGVKKSADELDAAAQLKAVKTAVGEFGEAAYYCCEAKDRLNALGRLSPDQLAELEAAQATLVKFSLEFTPSRDNG